MDSIQASINGSPTQIFSNNGLLSFVTDSEENEAFQLATREEYELADRCVGSIFESLVQGENIQLAEGYYILDADLDLVEDWQII